MNTNIQKEAWQGIESGDAWKADTLEELAAENPTIPLYKVDVSEEGSLAARFGIRSVPTLIRLENGKIREKKVGAVGKKELLSLLLS